MKITFDTTQTGVSSVMILCAAAVLHMLAVKYRSTLSIAMQTDMLPTAKLHAHLLQ